MPLADGRTIFERFPEITFYDYTKIPNRREIASLQGELGWSASDIESAVQPFLDDAYDREEREARRAQTPSRAALSQRWVEATRKRMRELPRHPGHDGPTVCCCTECVLWTIAAAALGELDGLAESAFDDEYVPERWHWPMSAAEVAAELRAERDAREPSSPVAEHTVAEHDVAERLRELAVEASEVAGE